jgi:3-hydroxyacyl-CoA dehydrogenase
MMGAMVKAKRMGRAGGAGMYDYVDGQRSPRIADFTAELCQRYGRNPVELSDHQVMLVLSLPMWIEAALALRDGVTDSPQPMNLAISGGLGYQSRGTWLEFFESLGSAQILETIEQFAPTTKSLRLPGELGDALARYGPSEAMQRFATR